MMTFEECHEYPSITGDTIISMVVRDGQFHTLQVKDARGKVRVEIDGADLEALLKRAGYSLIHRDFRT